MDKDGNGVIDFEEFCKWMQEEREKDSHQVSCTALSSAPNHFKGEINKH